MLALLGGKLLVEIAFDRAGGRARALPREEVHRPLLEGDRDAKQVGRILGLAVDAGEDRCADVLAESREISRPSDVSVDGLQDDLDGLLVGAQVGGEAALVADRGPLHQRRGAGHRALGSYRYDRPSDRHYQLPDDE